jgi:hypothetical protein
MSLAVTALLAFGVGAREMQPNILTSQQYDTGAIHEELMAKKMVRAYCVHLTCPNLKLSRY